MIYAMIVGFLITLIVIKYDPKVIRVEFKAIKNFMALLFLLTFLRLFLFSVAHSLGIDMLGINKGIGHIEFWRFGLVFWEDAFFAIPIYYMIDKWKWSKYISLPIIAALSIWFGTGHMYQFEAAYFATLVIPYAIFYKFGKRHGFGTTMICHILFDLVTFLTFKIAPLVL